MSQIEISLQRSFRQFERAGRCQIGFSPFEDRFVGDAKAVF